jgi:hypothetical protein
MKHMVGLLMRSLLHDAKNAAVAQPGGHNAKAFHWTQCWTFRLQSLQDTSWGYSPIFFSVFQADFSESCTD